MDETTRYSRESSASVDRLTANKQIVCVSVVDDYTISSGADCLRYRSGQDFRSISQCCLIDSSPSKYIVRNAECGISTTYNLWKSDAEKIG